jgi:hypothetical protein
MYYYKRFTLYEDKMDIKQNHYSTDFENGAVRVDELSDVMSSDSDGMSSDSDAELEGHCKKVTKRRATYESNIATEQGLIELGKHIAAKENAKQKRAAKYQYLVTSVKELEDFHGTQFLSEVSNCKDKNLVKVMVGSLVGYVSMFKELYSHHVEDISDLNKDIESLKVENADIREMVDQYIEDVDAKEAKLAKVADDVTRYKGIFAVQEKKLVECHRVMTQHKKIIRMVTDGNQIYSGNERIHQNEKRDWDDQKVALDNTVLRQQENITQLKKNAAFVQCFTRNCVYFSIGCVVYSMKYGNTPLCDLIGLLKH